MSNFLTWVTMGKYSLFVWPAYGVVGIVLVMNMLGIRWQRKNTFKRLQHWFKRQ